MAAYGPFYRSWGSSFLLIKIASRAFDPFGFALARVGVRGGGDAADERPSGAWPGTHGLWAKRRSRWSDRSFPSGDADHERRHGADDGRPAYLRLSVRPLSIARSLDAACSPRAHGRLRGGGRGVLVAGAGGGAHAISDEPSLLVSPARSHGPGQSFSGAATERNWGRQNNTPLMTISTLALGLTGLGFRDVRTLLSPTAALGVFNTALAYYVYFRLVNEEGPTFASLNNYIAPVIVPRGAWCSWTFALRLDSSACADRRRPPADRRARRKHADRRGASRELQ